MFDDRRICSDWTQGAVAEAHDPNRRRCGDPGVHRLSGDHPTLLGLIVYSIVLLSAGILVVGWVMLRAKVQLAAAWLAIITGVLGLLSLSGLGLFIMGNALAATAWLLFLGIWLSRLSRA